MGHILWNPAVESDNLTGILFHNNCFFKKANYYKYLLLSSVELFSFEGKPIRSP